MPEFSTPVWIESLENRQLLSVASFHAVNDVSTGDVVKVAFENRPNSSFTGEISNDNLEDLYKFKLKQQSTFDVRLRDLSRNADVKIVNESGRVFGEATHTGAHDERITTVLPKGEYWVVVSQADKNIHTGYTLRLTADLNWAKIENEDGTERNDVGLRFISKDTRPIRGDRNTYITIHDWNDTPKDMARVGNAIKPYIHAEQVLTLDWSDAARASTQEEAAEWIEETGKLLSDLLTRYGLETERVTVIGHGLGAYVAAEASVHFDRGLKAIVALDPSDGVSGYNFRWRTQTSLAFIGSDLASDENATTADSSFLVDLDGADEAEKHLHVRDLYASMLRSNAFRTFSFGVSDEVSPVFSLNQLHANGHRPWDVNEFGNGHEGRLTASMVDDRCLPEVLVYRVKDSRVYERAK